ncbi:IS5 family transposase [Aquisalimonas sp. 2447]|uniref:IS5 family transposase n=1 Tax=Aquisalimonas sp. 2447 TaxID=2740807 RepID=UPI0014326A42|nr:IS5 family transposase [Aquisalimonas sp. 2447]QIT54438.1 IS5 family transposase [Aquisalimonas sp. 2447]
MGPRDERHTPQDDLFRSELVNLIDPRHPLVKLADRIDWSVFEREWSELFASPTGRPAAPPRLIAGLLYLQHAYNLSDEAVVERWVENVYYQHFCGEKYFQHEFPIDPSSLTRWRQRIGEEGVELLLAETVEVAKRDGVVKRQSLERVTVDTTVQEKAITYPTDAKLYARGIRNLTKLAQQHGVPLRQSYARKAPEALLMVNRYAKARQMKRKRRMTKRLKTYLGRVTRDIDRKIEDAPEATQAAFQEPLHRANRLLSQTRKSKNKLLSWHAPEVEVIGKGKVAKPWEFGVKVSVAVTNKESFVVGCRSMPNNPFDGHTLAETLEQTEILSGVAPKRCYVDRGYKGAAIPGVQIFRSGQKRGVNTRTLKRELKRRSAVEAVIGHMKTDGRMDRCRLKGALGDALNAVLVAAGHNIRLLLRAMAILLRELLRRLPAMIGAGIQGQDFDPSMRAVA